MFTSADLVAGAIALAAGTLTGFLGMGGAAVLPPLLALSLGVEQHLAQGISLAALLPPVGLPAVLTYRRAGVRVDLVLVAALAVGFLLGAPAGAWLAHRVPSRELRWAFAAFLAFSAWRALSTVEDASTAGGGRSRRRWAGVPIGLAAGVASGALGVGGAFIALPLLRRFAGLGRLEAQATSIAMLLPPIALPAVYVYAREQGGLPWPMLIIVALGFAAGAAAGARAAGRVSERLAARVYAALLGVVAIALVVKG